MTHLSTELDPAELRRTFACFPSGIAAVCGSTGTELVGLAVSSFTSVSIEPALVSCCIQKTSRTWPTLSTLPFLGVSILAKDQTAAARSLAAKEGDRFAAVDWHETDSGAVLIEQAAAWLDCSLHTHSTLVITSSRCSKCIPSVRTTPPNH